MGSQRALPALLAEEVVPLRLRRVVAFMSPTLLSYVSRVKSRPERAAKRRYSHCFEFHAWAETRKSPPSADLLLSGAPRFLGGLEFRYQASGGQVPRETGSDLTSRVTAW